MSRVKYIYNWNNFFSTLKTKQKSANLIYSPVLQRLPATWSDDKKDGK